MKRGWVVAIIVVGVLIVAGVVVMSITRWGWAWTGLVGYFEPSYVFGNYHPGKTLWDLLELLIVPAALALTALLFSNREKRDDRAVAEKRAEFDRDAADKRAKTERDIATDRLQEAALQAYYSRMSELLLEENLREAEEGTEVISIARSMTLATLRSLDSDRKGMLIKFLCETKLIDKSRVVVNLEEADLSEANFFIAKLNEADLKNTNLMNAKLVGAGLSGADLSGADLGRADLSGADLSRSDLSGANLSGADLSRADLSRADLSRANLSGADLFWAHLDSANLRAATLWEVNLFFANLKDARDLTQEQLSMVKTLHGATMMDGTVYNPEVHTDITLLRKEKGLNDGNTSPIKIVI